MNSFFENEENEILIKINQLICTLVNSVQENIVTDSAKEFANTITESLLKSNSVNELRRKIDHCFAEIEYNAREKTGEDRLSFISLSLLKLA